MTEPRAPWARPRQQTVRLVCPCGRNLADIRLIFRGLSPRGAAALGPDIVAAMRAFHPEPESVTVVPRPGVRQSEHRHGDGGFTVRWDCRCSKTWQARRDRLIAVWQEHSTIGRITRLTLGTDV
jgi:hypothetical protein